MTSAPLYVDSLCTVYQGEALRILRELPSQSVSLVLTDPPYSSGGLMRGDRCGASTGSKYQQSQTLKRHTDFSGDNRDQRSFTTWSALWISELQRIMRPGALIGIFTDWRQLPSMTDAMQAGGIVWRGILPCIKPCPRPIKGRPSNAAEYLLWGSAGARTMEGTCFPGVLPFPPNPKKRHMTEKPVSLMRSLCQITAHDPEPRILDPFMGGGTTLQAARELGIPSIGIELNAEICAVGIARLQEPLTKSV